MSAPRDPRRPPALLRRRRALEWAAGALLAQTTAFVSLDVFEFHRSADLLLVLIIGGAGWLYGGIAGAVIYKMLQDGIATLTPQGRALHDSILGVALERERALLSVLEPAERDTLVGLLKRLHENLPAVEHATEQHIARHYPGSRRRRASATRGASDA